MTSGEVRAITALTTTGELFAQRVGELYDTSARIGSEQLRAAGQHSITQYRPAEGWAANTADWMDVPPPQSPAVGPTQGYGMPSYTGNHHRDPVEQPTDDSTFPGFVRPAPARPTISQSHPSHMASPAVVARTAPSHPLPATEIVRHRVTPEQIRGIMSPNVIASPLGALAANVLVIPGADGAQQRAPLPANPVRTSEPIARLSTETYSVATGRAAVKQPTYAAAAASIGEHVAPADTSPVTTLDNFSRDTPGASSYETLLDRLDPHPDDGNNKPKADYGDIADWYSRLAPRKRPAGYMQDTAEIVVPIRDQAPQTTQESSPHTAQRTVTPAAASPARQTMTTNTGEVLEMPTAVMLIPDLNEPFDHKSVDPRTVGMLVPSQEVLSSKADPKYSGRHGMNRRAERKVNAYKGEHVTKSHLVRTAAYIGSLVKNTVKKTVLYSPAMAGYTLAGNEAYTHYLPMLLQR